MIQGITNLMVIFEGSISYEELRRMPIPELSVLHGEAKRIQSKRSG